MVMWGNIVVIWERVWVGVSLDTFRRSLGKFQQVLGLDSVKAKVWKC